MRANRRTDTKPELALRHALHRLGYRYRKDYRLDLDSGRRVRPDIAFTARKVAVFVDGCFWHACPEHGSKPRANEWYWGPKLVRNVERDRINDAALILAGWSVIRLWEHVPLEEAVRTVVAAISAPNLATASDSAATSGSAATSNPHRVKPSHRSRPGRRRIRPSGRTGPGQPGRRGQLRRPFQADPARRRRFSRLARRRRRRLWQTLGHHARVPAFDAPGAGRGPAGQVGPGSDQTPDRAPARSPGTRSRPRCARRTRAATRKNSSTPR